MNILSLMQRFPDQHACIEQLERVRFDEEPYCPLCGNLHVARKRQNNVVGRWNCHGCSRASMSSPVP
ncbi:MAG: transposase [Truepera sp.]|nr:transposase [Truepera sp.]